MFSLFCLWEIVVGWGKTVDPSFICGYKPAQKILLVALKTGQTLLGHFHISAFMVQCQQPRHSSWDNIFTPNFAVEIISLQLQQSLALSVDDPP